MENEPKPTEDIEGLIPEPNASLLTSDGHLTGAGMWYLYHRDWKDLSNPKILALDNHCATCEKCAPLFEQYQTKLDRWYGFSDENESA